MKSLLFLIIFAFQAFAVSTGSYTVGSGGDYANWAAAAAATENLTGNLTFAQISDVTDNTALAFNVALGGYTLTLTSNKAHKGNFQGGWKTTFSMNLTNTAAITITCSSAGAGAKINVSELNIVYTGTITTLGSMIQLASNTTNITNTVNNCIVNANSKAVIAFRLMAANCVAKIYNCEAANGVSPTGTTYSAGLNIGTGCHLSTVIENCTFYKFINQGSGNATGFNNFANSICTLKNVAAIGNTADFRQGAGYTVGFGNAVATKCASTDTSGTEAGLRSLADTAQFKSVTITDGDLFLKLKSTGALDDAGVAPSIAANTTGIRGTARPHDTNKYSIGADEFKSTRPSVVITTSTATHDGLTALTATVTFSESVTGLDSSEVTATNCVKAGFSGSGAVYTYTITPTGTDDIVISAPENIAIDLYANGNTAATNKTVTYVSPSTATRIVKKSFKNYDRNYRAGFKNF